MRLSLYVILHKCTLPLLRHTASAILLPDVDTSAEYRLGVEADLSDPAVARVIAKWYRELHDKGAAGMSPAMYDETDLLTMENMAFVAEKTGTTNNPLWHVLEAHYDVIRQKISALPRTLTYNDFYYTNLIVSKDKSSAFMFDYNLLGKGIPYGDVQNVVSSLSQKAAAIFCEEYGINGMVEQAAAVAVISHLVTLYFACNRNSVFPSWAKESLGMLNSGELLRRLTEWIACEN